MYKLAVNDNFRSELSPSSDKIELMDVLSENEEAFSVIYKNKNYAIRVLKFSPGDKSIHLLINGNKYKVDLEDQYDALLKSMGMGSSGAKKMKSLKAPMPGLVLDVLIKVGDSIQKDTPLVVLEAMKMENVIKSTGEATVKGIEVSKGAAVEKNQILIHFE